MLDKLLVEEGTNKLCLTNIVVFQNIKKKKKSKPEYKKVHSTNCIPEFSRQDY